MIIVVAFSFCTTRENSRQSTRQTATDLLLCTSRWATLILTVQGSVLLRFFLSFLLLSSLSGPVQLWRFSDSRPRGHLTPSSYRRDQAGQTGWGYPRPDSQPIARLAQPNGACHWQSRSALRRLQKGSSRPSWSEGQTLIVMVLNLFDF